MTASTIFDHPGTDVSSRAYGYARGLDGAFTRSDAAGDPLFAIIGDGGIYSSVTDLFRWDQALYTETLVSHANLAAAFTPGQLNDGSSIPYGFGWRLGSDAHGVFVAHGGAYAGFETGILRYPDRRGSVVVLTNRQEGDASALAQTVAGVYFGSLMTR